MGAENIGREQTEFDERGMNLAAEREKINEMQDLITEGRVWSMGTISNSSI
jgi:hypothetical protein